MDNFNSSDISIHSQKQKALDQKISFFLCANKIRVRGGREVVRKSEFWRREFFFTGFNFFLNTSQLPEKLVIVRIEFVLRSKNTQKHYILLNSAFAC